MEAQDLVQKQTGSLDRRYVEIHSVDQEVEAQDNYLNQLGASVDPNGKRGLAHWDWSQNVYHVTTLDGLVLTIPEAHLREYEQTSSCDLVWPEVPFNRAGTTFAHKVVETLQANNYCVIEMPDADKMGSIMELALKERTDYTLPKKEFEEGLLGRKKDSKVLFCQEAQPFEGPARDAFQYYYRHLANLSDALLPASKNFLGLNPWPELYNSLLRVPCETEAEYESLSPGPVTKEDIENGLVETHLDFTQRRTLCFVYSISGEKCSIELYPKLGLDSETETVKLNNVGGKLVVFRHDKFSYSYLPGKQNVVLQSWLLEQPQELRLETLQGDQGRLEGILGGPAMAPDKQVHVMAGMCRFPGNALKIEKDWLVYAAEVDTFVEIPFYRFDLSIYYTDDAEQFGNSGKSSTKHAGLLHDKELIEFDNNFFGIDFIVAMGMPCIQRVLLETAYEGFTMCGHTMKTLNGLNTYACVADIGIEWDSFQGYQQCPDQWLEATSAHSVSTSARLAHMFGLRGPCIQVDTACSASLVGSNLVHAALRRSKENSMTEGFITGQQHIIQPWPFIGLSAAGMLGRGGRSKTFDQSANGYNRGEGCGGLWYFTGDDLRFTQERLACYIGSYVNQDGRSASLTAPNGPSQQAVVRGSLTQGQIMTSEPCAQENHGTGTALGDPIETGTVRSVFRKRELCLPTTSGKSHQGHLEAGAGMIGILKIICSALHGAIPGNCHVRQINAHCEFDGFPGTFPVESCCVPTDYHYIGANGFGFGGTNSRCDFWVHRRNKIHNAREQRGEILPHHYSIGDMDTDGTRNPLMPRLEMLDMIAVECARCSGPMCWLCGMAVLEHTLKGKHHCEAIRAESSSYTYCSNCYEGEYQREGAIQDSNEAFIPGQKVYLTSTADVWANLHEMEPVAGGVDIDMYQGEIVLGETRAEQFHLVVKRGKTQKIIHPILKNAGQRVRIMGPAEDKQRRNWLIDGHRDGAPHGTVYQVRFYWGDFEKSIEWEPIRQEAPQYPHQYFLVNSLSRWVPAGSSQDLDDPSIFHWFQGLLPASGMAELFFCRDGDLSQAIYPMQSLTSQPTDTSIPVVGPDDGGQGKRWLAFGAEGEALCVDLQVKDGNITVTVGTETMGKWIWNGRTCHTHYVVGSFNNWNFGEMEIDEEFVDVRIFRFTIGKHGREEFQILLDQNWNMRMYPASNGEAPGSGLPCGPDRKGKNKHWEVVGRPGEEMEIRLNLNPEDDLSMVTCGPAWWWEEDAD